jgi:hypothetical protein
MTPATSVELRLDGQHGAVKRRAVAAVLKSSRVVK